MHPQARTASEGNDKTETKSISTLEDRL